VGVADAEGVDALVVAKEDHGGSHVVR
jgi:hypothetical protein